MRKTLYSLMLSDEVVREIDLLAHRSGTNRSNLINQILADYVDLTTPERRISDIFKTIERLIQPSRELIPFFAPNTQTMSLKSSLEYKYRPTVKYEVELYRSQDGALGELSVIFRTQSAALISAMTDFFRLWKSIEDKLLRPLLPDDISYALYDGKFVRSISVPVQDCGAEELAAALSDYIQLFDTLMKGQLTERLSRRDVEAEYAKYVSEHKLYI